MTIEADDGAAETLADALDVVYTGTRSASAGAAATEMARESLPYGPDDDDNDRAALVSSAPPRLTYGPTLAALLRPTASVDLETGTRSYK